VAERRDQTICREGYSFQEIEFSANGSLRPSQQLHARHDEHDATTERLQSSRGSKVTGSNEP